MKITVPAQVYHQHMQSNIREFDNETEHYPASAYENYPSDEYADDWDNNTYPDDDYGYDDDYLDEEYIEPARGKKHVLHLVLFLLLIILIIAVVLFGLIPYIESLNQGTIPPLPPAIQT